MHHTNRGSKPQCRRVFWRSTTSNTASLLRFPNAARKQDGAILTAMAGTVGGFLYQLGAAPLELEGRSSCGVSEGSVGVAGKVDAFVFACEVERPVFVEVAV